MCVHLPGMSPYSGTSACTEKTLLIFKTVLNNKISFVSAEFTLDAYTRRAQGTRSTLQVDRKAKLLSWHPGTVMRWDPGRDPARMGVTAGTAQHCAPLLHAQGIVRRALAPTARWRPKAVKTNRRHNITQEKRCAKPSGGTSPGGETCCTPDRSCSPTQPRYSRAAPSTCQRYNHV